MDDLKRRLVAEGLGTAFLLASIVGAGIMADNLAGGDKAVSLIANALTVGGVLVVIILIFGPVSGAHFNPAVTLSFYQQKQIGAQDAAFYIAAQVVGGTFGVLVTHASFGQELVQLSPQIRADTGLYIGEFIATFGLIGTVIGCIRFRPEATPYAVGLYIMAAIWFTSSTSFANPAVTIARTLTDSFTGIRALDAPWFIGTQIIAALVATTVFVWLVGGDEST